MKANDDDIGLESLLKAGKRAPMLSAEEELRWRAKRTQVLVRVRTVAEISSAPGADHRARVQYVRPAARRPGERGHARAGRSGATLRSRPRRASRGVRRVVDPRVHAALHHLQSPYRAYAVVAARAQAAREPAPHAARNHADHRRTARCRDRCRRCSASASATSKRWKRRSPGATSRAASIPKAARWSSSPKSRRPRRSWRRPKSASGRCAQFAVRCRTSASASATSCSGAT